MLGSMLLVSNELSIQPFHLGLGKGFEAPAFSKYPKSENKVISSQILLSFLGVIRNAGWVWTGDSLNDCCWFFFFWTMLHGMWDLSSSTRDRTLTPCSRSRVLTTRSPPAKSLQSCLTLCNPIDGSPPGANAWKWKVKVKTLSRVRLLATPWTAAYQAPPSMGSPGKSIKVCSF